MAHEIENANLGENASAFYVGQPAWHGLGHVLENAPTISEAIDLAGLNWDVKRSRLYFNVGNVRKPTDCYAIVRSADDKCLGVVGEAFKPVQNRAAFEWFQPVLDAGLADLESAGSLRGGSRVWILAKLRAADDVIVKEADDRVERYLLLAHGHDGSLAIRVGCVGTRVVCANTLKISLGEGGTLRVLHTKNVHDAMAAAQDLVLRAGKKFDKAADVFRALANVKVKDAAQIRDYVNKVFPWSRNAKESREAAQKVDAVALMNELRAEREESELVENLLENDRARRADLTDKVMELFESGKGNDLPGVKGTAWAAYNGVTQFLTHERGNDPSTRLHNAWLGSQGDRALKGAMETFLEGSGN